MSYMRNCFEYNIVLPDTTDNEVLEWFAFMKSQGSLTDELIRLVAEYIKTNNNPNISINMPQLYGSCTAVNQVDLFENLYNCFDSASAVFHEEKKTKKKMLSV